LRRSQEKEEEEIAVDLDGGILPCWYVTSNKAIFLLNIKEL